MGNRRYGPPSGQPVSLAEYHQSKDELAGLPQTVSEKVLAIAERLVREESQVPFRICSRSEAEGRHVLELLRLEDPAGTPVEIFHGPHVRFSKPFHPGRGMHGKFVIGTGGLANLIAPQTTSIERVDDALTLHGLRLLYERNVDA